MGQNFPYVLPLRERQTVVLAWHPDHIVGPARSTNVKPIFGIAPPCYHSILFHARWCALAHGALLANDSVNRMKIRLLADLAEQDAMPSA